MRKLPAPGRGHRGRSDAELVSRLRPSGAEAKPASRRAGELLELARRTARLWGPGLTYDQAIAVATRARRELGLVAPQVRRSVVARLSRPELDRLLDHAYHNPSGLRPHHPVRGLMVKVLFFTGARVAEFVRMEVEDLHLSDLTVHLFGKGRKHRIVPILPLLAHELAIHLGHRRAGPVFPNPEGRAYSTRRIEQIVSALARGAGIERRVYPHLVRHTVAQLLLEGGMSLEQIAKFLGHASVTTTQIYAESTPAMIRGAYVEALG